MMMGLGAQEMGQIMEDLEEIIIIHGIIIIWTILLRMLKIKQALYYPVVKKVFL